MANTTNARKSFPIRPKKKRSHDVGEDARFGLLAPVSLSRCASGLESTAEYVVTLMMLCTRGRGSDEREYQRDEENSGRNALVVVGDVAGHGGEANVGRERQCQAAHGEAVGPVVP